MAKLQVFKLAFLLSLSLLFFQNCSHPFEPNFTLNSMEESSDSASLIPESESDPKADSSIPSVTPNSPSQASQTPTVVEKLEVQSLYLVSKNDLSIQYKLSNLLQVDITDWARGIYYIKADVSDNAALVEFTFNNIKNDEVNPPYTSSEFEPSDGGVYQVRVVAYADKEKSGAASEAKVVQFSVKAAPASPKKDLLFFGGYESNEGVLNSSTFDKHWGLLWKRAPTSHHEIVRNSENAFDGNSLRIKYPGKTLGSGVRVNYGSDFKKLGIGLRESAYLRYYVKFNKGWDWAITGKVPGLGGYKTVSGGDAVSGKDGWSMRFVWYDGEKVDPAIASLYAYIAGKGGVRKTSKYGYVFRLKDPKTQNPMSFPVDKWTCIELYVQLNEVGKYNGVVKAWIDGVLGADLNDLMYRTVDNEANKVGRMMFSTFFGGGNDNFAPSRDVYASFDNFAISETRIGCSK